MAGDRITRDLLALPLAERISLAQTLWDSIDDELVDTDEAEAVAISLRRRRELSEGSVTAIARDEAMREARRKL